MRALQRGEGGGGEWEPFAKRHRCSDIQVQLQVEQFQIMSLLIIFPQASASLGFVPIARLRISVSNACPVRSETEWRGSEYAGHGLAHHVAATETDTGRPATGAPLAD
jgi:hypothetical protein